MSNRIRTGLIAFGWAVLAVAISIKIFDALQSGSLVFRFSKGQHREVIFLKSADPLAYYLWLGVGGLLAMLFLAAAIMAANAVMTSSPAADRTINSIIGRMEQRAPSGLKPLWIGLLIVGAIATLYSIYS